MLHQLLSSHDNYQSMVIYPLVMEHAQSVVASNDNCQSIVIYPKGINHAPSVVIVS